MFDYSKELEQYIALHYIEPEKTEPADNGACQRLFASVEKSSVSGESAPKAFMAAMGQAIAAPFKHLGVERKKSAYAGRRPVRDSEQISLEEAESTTVRDPEQISLEEAESTTVRDPERMSLEEAESTTVRDPERMSLEEADSTILYEPEQIPLEVTKTAISEKYEPEERDISAAVHEKPAKFKKETKARSLEDVVRNLDKSFMELVFSFADMKGMSDVEVQKKANIDRKAFSKLKCGTTKNPSKPTALALAIALELNLDETKDLLSRAGLALSPCSRQDVIVQFFIEKEAYDIFVINEALYAHGEPTL